MDIPEEKPVEPVIPPLYVSSRSPKPRRMRNPTIRQIKALQYVNQGMSKRQAMKKAGYSKAVWNHNSSTLMKKQGVQQMLGSMQGKLTDAGLTTEYMAKKFKEWLEAQKIHTSHTEPDREVPDYDTQIKAYDRWEKVIGVTQGTKGKVKRQMTVTEFVMGDEGEAPEGGIGGDDL